MLGYFHKINIQEFILHPEELLYSLSKFIVKLSPMPLVFSRKGFHINLVFFPYFVFLYCSIDHNKCHDHYGMIC